MNCLTDIVTISGISALMVFGIIGVIHRIIIYFQSLIHKSMTAAVQLSYLIGSNIKCCPVINSFTDGIIFVPFLTMLIKIPHTKVIAAVCIDRILEFLNKFSLCNIDLEFQLFRSSHIIGVIRF